MDEQYQQYNHNDSHPDPSINPVKVIHGHSKAMAFASLTCGILAIVSCTCFYFSLIFGSMAILFGLLSRGGERHMTDKATVGVALGGTGLGLTAVIYVIAFGILIQAYGGIANLTEAMNEMEDMSVQEMYSDVYEHLQDQLGDID